jgi:hypothetical protein
MLGQRATTPESSHCASSIRLKIHDVGIRFLEAGEE